MKGDYTFNLHQRYVEDDSTINLCSRDDGDNDLSDGEHNGSEQDTSDDLDNPSYYPTHKVLCEWDPGFWDQEGLRGLYLHMLKKLHRR